MQRNSQLAELALLIDPEAVWVTGSLAIVSSVPADLALPGTKLPSPD
jgi:hypothetical protein